MIMKNKHVLFMSLLILIFASVAFLSPQSFINDQLDPAQCNCSGPKASKSQLNDD